MRSVVRTRLGRQSPPNTEQTIPRRTLNNSGEFLYQVLELKMVTVRQSISGLDYLYCSRLYRFELTGKRL